MGRDQFYCKDIFPERQQIQAYDALLKKRIQGTPVAYLTGCKEFWSLPLKVNQDTLIPRPETEHLVQQSLVRLDNLEKNYQVLELGTGCGAVAIALAKERPKASIFATDVSPKALKIGKYNAKKFQISNIQLICSYWLNGISDLKFDLIISNPPYVDAKQTNAYDSVALAHEPRVALFADDHGRSCIKEITQESIKFLKRDGWLIIEHGYNQSGLCQQLMQSFQLRAIQTTLDYSGIGRITAGQRYD
jgi:release factor glutamine methyltransferase